MICLGWSSIKKHLGQYNHNTWQFVRKLFFSLILKVGLTLDWILKCLSVYLSKGTHMHKCSDHQSKPIWPYTHRNIHWSSWYLHVATRVTITLSSSPSPLLLFSLLSITTNSHSFPTSCTFKVCYLFLSKQAIINFHFSACLVTWEGVVRSWRRGGGVGSWTLLVTGEVRCD